jgi:hypothetical protein
MNNLQSLANLRFNTFTSLTSRGKSQSRTKPQDLTSIIISVAIQGQCTTLILTGADHRRIGRKFLGHLRKNGTGGPPTIDSISIAKEVAHQTVAAVTTEALTRSNLRTACIMVVKLTTAPKIAPSSWSQKGKCINIPQNLRSNQHLEKSTTPCSKPLTISNILHFILHSSHHKLTKIAKANIRRIINPSITPQPITHSLPQLQR